MTFNPSDPGYTKATEAMARAMYELRNGGYVWNEGNERTRDFYRADARAALAALEEAGLVLADVDAKNRTIRELDRLVCEFCKAVGEPVPVDAIVIAQQHREAATDTRELALVAALAHLADIHHRTITGSRLHDPERIEDFIDCPCRTCRFVTETLVAYADSREVQ